MKRRASTLGLVVGLIVAVIPAPFAAADVGDGTVSFVANVSGRSVTSPSNSALVPNTTAANAERSIVLHL